MSVTVLKHQQSQATSPQRWVFAGFALLLAAAALQLDGYGADLFNKLLLIATLTVSFSFLFGIAGLLAVSHIAFYGIGAYVVTILSVSFGTPVVIAIPVTVVVCALIALLIAIPTIRLDGYYLALGTLALAQLLTVVLVQGGSLTGGSEGLYGFTDPRILGIPMTGRPYSFVIIAMFLLSLALLIRLDKSFFGRACRAIRDNPAAAQAMGVNPTSIKVTVFVLTSLIACVAGIAYAFLENYVTPYVFSLNLMFQVLFMAIVGGLGRMSGAIIGSVILFLAPEYMGFLGDHYLLFYGVLMVLCTLFAPRGIIGLFDRAGIRLP